MSNKEIYIKYSIWFVIISAACALWGSVSWELSVPLFGVSSLMLLKKKDFKKKLSKKQLVIPFLFIAFMILSAVMGWTSADNKKWEHFIYRPYVAVICWLLLMAVGMIALKKELRTNFNDNEKAHNKSLHTDAE